MGNCVYHEGAFGTHLLSKDIVDEPVQFGKLGQLDIKKIRQLPGLGVQVNTQELESLTHAVYS